MVSPTKVAYSLAEVAEATGLSLSTVKRLVGAGSLRSVYVGRRRLVLPEALDELLSQGVSAVAS